MRRVVVGGVMGGLVWVGGRWSLLSRAGSGDGVSLGGRGRGDLQWCVSAGTGDGGGLWGSPRGASVAWSRGGGRGGVGVGAALLVVGGAGVGVVLDGSLGVPPGRMGVACARRAVLVVPGWLRCPGGRKLWVLEVEVTVVDVEGEKDVAGRHVQAAPLWRRGGLWGGMGVLAVAMAMIHAWSATPAT